MSLRIVSPGRAQAVCGGGVAATFRSISLLIFPVPIELISFDNVEVIRDGRISCSVDIACLAYCLSYGSRRFAAGRCATEDLIFNDIGSAIIGRFFQVRKEAV